MQERRLDTRLFKSKPYEMALPTLQMTQAARAYQSILTTLQCGAVLLTLAAMVRDHGTISSIPVIIATIFTAMYVVIHVVRLLPFGDKLDGRQWWLGQLVAWFIEIILLAALDVIYSGLQVNHASYWWALYLLPVYSLAEFGGIVVWAASLILSFILLSLVAMFGVSRGESPGLVPSLGKMLILTLFTFIPIYIVRALDLSLRAARFWYPLSSRFIASSSNISWSKKLLRSVFEEGVDTLLGADSGALWKLDTQECEAGLPSPVLRLVYIYSRERRSPYFWHRWKPGRTSTQDMLVPADAVLREHGGIAHNQVFVESSKEERYMDNPPWLVRSQPDIHSWLVVPVCTEEDKCPIGFFEVGMRRRLRTYEWPGVESRVVAVAEALGEVFERIRQTRAEFLKKKLTELEYEAKDEAALYRLAVEAVSDYFRRPVLMVEYSRVVRKIQTVVGDLEPSKIEWLGNWLAKQEREGYRTGEISFCRPMEHPPGERTAMECYLVCPLISRETMVEMIVLVDHTDQFTTADHQVLRDSAMAINAAVIRRRAANLLQPNVVTSLEPRATRRRLRLLARKVKEDTLADVVVLYEFEEGRPKLPPIIVGHLKNPEYLQAKPIVIEEPNPILRVVRAGEPQFFEQIQSDPMGTGENRHGDPVFAVREGIASSVGLPLKTERGVVGVMWINFRVPQVFDRTNCQYYYELFKHLPRQLESVQLMEAARSLTEQRTRERILSDWHDHTLQDLLALGGYLSSIEASIQTGQATEALEYLSTAFSILDDAERNARAILDDLHEISQESDIAQQLSELVRRLQDEYDLPEEFRGDGLNEIPTSLYGKLYPVIREATINAAKHGQAKRIVVQASSVGGVLQIVIKDNGLGFEPRPACYGYGIRSMQSRIRWLGGNIRIGSKKGKGTGIVVEVPIPIDEAEDTKHGGTY